MNKEQIIQGIADRIKAEETKHSHSIPDWHKIAAAKIYATWLVTASDSETDENRNSPYCTVCGSCGEDGCCSALSCQQHPDGDYCQTYLKELQFGYKMYRQLHELVSEDERYKDQIDKMWNEEYDLTFKSE